MAVDDDTSRVDDAARARVHARLMANVAPDDWPWPTPADRYNLVVLGGGPAGLVAAMGAAGLGARVALVERSMLGGDCLHSGCVPSKVLLREARALSVDVERLRSDESEWSVVTGAVMDRVRNLRAELSVHDSAERLREAGVDVFFGSGGFVSADQMRVDGQRESATLRFRRCLVATGSHPVVPEPFHEWRQRCDTPDSVFEWTRLPKRLAIVGGGAAGCELSEAFARLGVQVTLVEQRRGLLPDEVGLAGTVIANGLRQAGVSVRLESSVETVELHGEGLQLGLDGGETLLVDRVLLCAGRCPSLPSGLDLAAIEHAESALRVDARLRTSNPRVFGAGDVLGTVGQTHAADHQARLVLRNALFGGRRQWLGHQLPRVIHTEPEVALIGGRDQWERAGHRARAIELPLACLDRNRVDGVTDGICRLQVSPDGRILAAVAVGAGAGELMGALSLAVQNGLTLENLSETMFPYLTRMELLGKLGDAFQRERLTPQLREWSARWLSLWR